jgi:hypothetical protein
MKIKNVDGLSAAQIREQVNQGGKFVMYKYCISILVMTFNNPTDVYFIAPGKSRFTPAIGFLICNLLLGWWGIPWGPIYTLGNIGSILSGGKDVTAEIMGSINQNDSSYATGNNYNIPGQTNNNSSGASAYNIPAQNSGSNSGTSAYNIPR